MTNPPNITLTPPSGFAAKVVVARNGLSYAVDVALGTITLPYAQAPTLIAAGFVAGAIS